MNKIYSEEGIVLPETIEIPKLSKDELIQLYKKIKPMVTLYDIKYLLKEFTIDEVINNSYLWDVEKNKRDIVSPYNLKEIDEFACLHRYAYYGFFKPSIAEVLSQLPEQSKMEADVFEIVEEPITRDDIFKYPEVIDKGMQLSKVKTYKLYK